MINYLTLKNFRKHRDAHFDFLPGLNVICGPNWAGKTTILSAIAYALFGAKAAQGSAQDLITHGEAEMLVSVGFSIESARYFVSRGPKKAELRVGSTQNKPVATGQVPVTEEIENLIGTSAKDFLSFNVTRQEDSASLLSFGSAKLGEYVARVTGVDTIDKVLDGLKVEVTKSEAVFTAYPDCSEEVRKMGLFLEDTVGSTNRMQASIGLLKTRLNFTQEASLKIAEEARKLRELRDSCAEAKRKAAVQKGILANAKEVLKKSQEKLQQKPASDIEAMVEAARKADEAHNNFLRYEEVERDLLASIASAESNLALYPEEIQEPANFGLIKTEELEASNLLEDAERILTQAIKAYESSECPYCMRPFEGADQDQLKKEKEAAENAVEKASERLRKASEASEEAMRKKVEFEELTHGKKQWENYLDTVLKQRQEHLKNKPEEVTAEQVRQMSDELACEKQLWDAYNAQAAEVARRQKDVMAASNAVRELTKSDKVKAPTTGEVEAAERSEREVLEEITSVTTEIGKLNHLIELNTQAVTSTEQTLRRMYDQQALKEGAGARLKLAKELQTYLRKNRDRFTESFWTQMLEHASEFVRSATSEDVSELRVGKGFSYVEEGRELSVAGNASGMQKAIFSTAIKLSLIAALGSRFEVLFFDEVTAAAGDDTSLLFTTLLAKAGQQTFLVTHRPADAAVADQLIEVASR